MAGGPGRSEREGLTLAALFQQFPDGATAEAWFAAGRWPDGPICPHCDHDNIKSGAKHPTMPYRCRGCTKYFSVKTGTVMEGSNLGYQTWAIAIYRMTTSLRGVSSMQLHRDLGISQKAAWHLAHRIRARVSAPPPRPMTGPVEVDETFIGGREGNKHEAKRRGNMGHDGKVAVIGAKDRATGTVRAEVLGTADAPRMRAFVRRQAAPKATVYSDGHGRLYVAGRGVPASGRPARGGDVRDLRHAHERHRGVLVAAQARLPRHLFALERQAHPPLPGRVHGPLQRSRTGHRGPDGGHRAGDAGEAAPVPGPGGLEVAFAGSFPATR